MGLQQHSFYVELPVYLPMRLHLDLSCGLGKNAMNAARVPGLILLSKSCPNYEGRVNITFPEGPSTQKPLNGMGFGTRVLEHWVLGPFRFALADRALPLAWSARLSSTRDPVEVMQ